jgi:hypothetical protein
MAEVPSVAQNVDTVGDRQFFETLMHELFHVLGISGGLMERWLDPVRHVAYGNSLPLYEIHDGSGKVFRILHTPRIHQVIAERFGYEFFGGDGTRPVGVELEDNGGSGTIGSHWEGRTYFTEFMEGTTFGYGSISSISLAALEDTGWYGVNMSHAEGFAWGDYRSIRGSRASDFSNFLLGEPALWWPRHYIARSAAEAATLRCSFDLRATASVQFGQRDCSRKTMDECEFPSFYDAAGTGLYSYQGLDFALIPVPDVLCTGGNDVYGGRSLCTVWKLAGNGGFYYDAQCHTMVCGTEGVTIFVGDTEVLCTAGGQSQSVFGFTGTLICPDPDIVCGILAYKGNGTAVEWSMENADDLTGHRSVGNATHTNTSRLDSQIGLGGLEIGLIVGIAGALLAVAVIAVIVRWRRPVPFEGGGKELDNIDPGS